MRIHSYRRTNSVETQDTFRVNIWHLILYKASSAICDVCYTIEQLKHLARKTAAKSSHDRSAFHITGHHRKNVSRAVILV